MLTLTVDLGERSYPIHIGAGLLSQSALLSGFLPQEKVAIVTNRTIAPLYLTSVSRALEAAGVTVVPIVLPDGELYKNWETLNQIFDALIESRCERKTAVLALGGGVVGDLTGFAAAVYQRGVPYVQLPTTLLAQVDSSVGGKTAINHALGKNMIGAFYQPLAVVTDTDTLATLPERELSAGVAEIVKYGLIRDASFFAWLEHHMERLIAREPEALGYAIDRSCRIKAEIVALDERETGLRALLNFGHTFGHAIETGLTFGVWLHGEAVAAGMVLAARLSQRMGLIAQHDVMRITDLLKRARLPVAPPALRARPHVRLEVVPASRRQFDLAMRDGTLQALSAAGAVIGSSGCGPCLGRTGGVRWSLAEARELTASVAGERSPELGDERNNWSTLRFADVDGDDDEDDGGEDDDRRGEARVRGTRAKCRPDVLAAEERHRHRQRAGLQQQREDVLRSLPPFASASMRCQRSASISRTLRLGPTADGVVEPGTRKAPVAFDGRRRELQDFRNLVGGQAAKEFQLDDPALARIDGAESVERLVQDEDVHLLSPRGSLDVAQGNLPHVPPALAGGVVARMVDENPPHHDHGESDELRPVLPVDVPLIDQPKVGLVDERGGLERVVAPLAEEIPSGQPAQLVVHEREHLVPRALVTIAPVEQQPCDRARRGHSFSHILGCRLAGCAAHATRDLGGEGF